MILLPREVVDSLKPPDNGSGDDFFPSREPQTVDLKSFGLMGGGNPFSGLGTFAGQVKDAAGSGLGVIGDAWQSASRAANDVVGIQGNPLAAPARVAGNVLGEYADFATSGLNYIANNFAYSPYGDAQGNSIGMGDVMRGSLERTPGARGRIGLGLYDATDRLTAPLSLAALPAAPVAGALSPFAGVGAREAARAAGASERTQSIADFAGSAIPFVAPGAARLATRGASALNAAGDRSVLEAAAGPMDRSYPGIDAARTRLGEGMPLLTPVEELAGRTLADGGPTFLTKLGDLVKKIPAGFSLQPVEDDPYGIIGGLKQVSAEERALRAAGITEAEIRASRAARFASQELGVEQAGYGERVHLPTGSDRATIPNAVPHTQEGRLWLQEQVNVLARTKEITRDQYNKLSSAIAKGLDGVGLYPQERQILGQFLGEDVAGAFDSNAPAVSRIRPQTGMRGPTAPPSAASPPSAAPAAAKAARVASKRDSELAKEAAAEIRALEAQRAGYPSPPPGGPPRPPTGMSGPSPLPTGAIPPRESVAARQSERVSTVADRAAAQVRADADALAKQRSRYRNPPQTTSRPDTEKYLPSAEAPSLSSVAKRARARANEKMAIPVKRENTVMDQILDLLNIPRTIKSSFDLSAPFRQGSVLSARNPQEFWGAWYPMVKAFGSDSVSQAVDREIRGGAAGIIRSRTKLYLAPLKGGLSAREEAFASRLASRIPGVENSERAYITFLNKLRADVFDKNYVRLAESGLKGEGLNKAADEMAQFINWSTGRGDIAGKELASTLTNIFFSPRLLVSRFQVARSVLPKNFGGNIQNDLVRQIARENVASWMGQNMAVLGLIGVAGAYVGDEVVTVELDPRSTDFGKLRIGATRIDPWAGFQPLARATAQFATGQSKSSEGDIFDKNRMDTLLNFGRGKLNPIAGFATDQISEKDAIGNPVSTPSQRLLNSLGLVTPLGGQDIYQGWKEDGLLGAGLSLTGDVGFGVTSYSTPNEKLAREMGKPLSKMTKEDFQIARDQNPDLAAELSQEKIDRGGPGGQYEQVKQDLTKQQAASDAVREKGDLTAAQWVSQYHDRQQQLVGARAASYPDFKQNPKDAADRYYAQIDSAKQPDGTIDWEAVNQWLSKQSLPDQSDIDRDTGLGGTPQVREYRAMRKELDKSQYFDIYDRVWGRVATKYDISEYKTSREFEQAISARTRDRLVQKGITSRAEQDILVGKMIEDIEPLKVYRTFANDVQEAWIKENVGLAKRAIETGYINPATLRKAEIGAIFAEGRK